MSEHVAPRGKAERPRSKSSDVRVCEADAPGALPQVEDGTVRLRLPHVFVIMPSNAHTRH